MHGPINIRKKNLSLTKFSRKYSRLQLLWDKHGNQLCWMQNSPPLTHFIENHDGPRGFEDVKSGNRGVGCGVMTTWRQLPHFKDVSAFFTSTTMYSFEVRCLYTALQIKAPQTFETSISACVYQSTRRLIPEHLNFQRRRCEKIRTRLQKCFFVADFAV